MWQEEEGPLVEWKKKGRKTGFGTRRNWACDDITDSNVGA